MRVNRPRSAVAQAAALLALVGVLVACGDGAASDEAANAAPANGEMTSTTRQPTASTATGAPTTTTSAAPSTTTSTPTTVTDREPPPLAITFPEEGDTFTSHEVRFDGTTEPGAAVVVWDRWAATVAADGSWSIVLILEPGTNVARFTATDAAGNTSVAERAVRYDPPEPPSTTTTDVPQGDPATTVIVFYPTEVPEDQRQGSCSMHSVATWREDAYRCSAGSILYDPCFDTGDHVICDVSPIRPGPGFILDLTEPLPVVSVPDGVNPWILEFPDGVVCDPVLGTTGTIDGSRIEYGCSDGSWVLQNLRPGEVWTGRRVVIEGLGPPIIHDYGFTPIRRVWR
jgi:hypothetical protein